MKTMGSLRVCAKMRTYWGAALITIVLCAAGIATPIALRADSPWRRHPDNPVFTPGPGRWDWTNVLSPSVIKGDDGYRMYYSAYLNPLDRSGVWNAIGVATSPDGIHWTPRRDLNPIIMPTLEVGSWEYMSAMDPSVLKDGDVYEMWYEAADWIQPHMSIGYATSADGFH